FGVARLSNLIPEDMRPLLFDFGYSDPANPEAFRFNGELRNERAEGGTGGLVGFHGGALEVISEPGQADAGRISLRDDDLNSLGATVLGLGTSDTDGYTEPGNSVIVRSGSSLNAAAVLLAGNGEETSVVVESGATIDTRGRGSAGWTADNGMVLNPNEDQSLLAVGNDLMTFSGVQGEGGLRVEDGAGLFGEGSVALLAPGGAEIGEIAVGARDLLLGVESVNVG
ncbi:MAG TPA: hypothetical protein DD399_03605, partial [Alcanivorax sp.]|nr:hypothetical protein [Alcanivorax sp.]